MQQYITYCFFAIKRVLQFIIFLLLLPNNSSYAQSLRKVSISDDGRSVKSIVLSDSTFLTLDNGRPLFSFVADGILFSADNIAYTQENGSNIYVIGKKLKIRLIPAVDPSAEWSGTLQFENSGEDTISISNVVPFGESRSSTYITGYGSDDLARACLFLPGFRPIRVIMPDNAAGITRI